MRFTHFLCLDFILLLYANVVSTVPPKYLTSSTTSFGNDLLQRRSGGTNRFTASVTGHTDDTGEFVWLVPVGIRGQTFLLELDTGSDTTWVWSNEMSESAVSKGGNRRHAMYDLNAALHASPSRFVRGESFKISYLGPDSATAGVVVNDTVSIAGLETQMLFGAATSAGSAFSYSDGLIGLGWGQGNEIKPDRPPTFLQLVLDQLDAPIFTTLFKPAEAGGELGFGAIDPMYSNNLHKVSVDNSSALWGVRNLRFNVNGNTQRQTLVYFDLGAPTININNATVNAYWGAVEGAKRINDTDWATPCNTVLPDLIFTTPHDSNNRQIVPGSNLMGSTIDWWGEPGNTNTPMCYGALATEACTRGCAVMGAPFFSSHYVVFNIMEPSIQFALQK